MENTPEIDLINEPKSTDRKQYIIAFGLVLLVLILDQWLKLWVKTHMVRGQEIPVFGNWFILHFTENPGMAFGFVFGGEKGKLALTVFRIIAVTGITYFMLQQMKKKMHIGFVISLALILAGAMGNIIDSVFYGVAFDYAPYFHGRVVDMFYFPLFEGYYPDWVPYIGGNHFIFFRPVFNIADAAISIGVLSILFFQKNFFKKPENEPVFDEPASFDSDADHNQDILEKE